MRERQYMKALLFITVLVLGSFTVFADKPDAATDTALPFDSPVLSKIHVVLGYSTVAVGLATGIFNPERSGKAVHQTLAYTSAGLAATTMLFGYLAHRDDVGPAYGGSSNNVHMILGITGGTMMIIAPFLAPGTAHKVVGELGALTMGAGIVLKIVFP